VFDCLGVRGCLCFFAVARRYRSLGQRDNVWKRLYAVLIRTCSLTSAQLTSLQTLHRLPARPFETMQGQARFFEQQLEFQRCVDRHVLASELPTGERMDMDELQRIQRMIVRISEETISRNISVVPR
jgi:hypothetical protein